MPLNGSKPLSAFGGSEFGQNVQGVACGAQLQKGRFYAIFKAAHDYSKDFINDFELVEIS